ncbi:hypothetical protein EVAR_81154_1 [Eumeta japonica]|uniref:Uncharacterized protein n=1 Tax=Eumeta variegata TaxID=151549 RepID=A0A4C1UKF0_EUMVA|nr:hypothetical protein EVAR_81154_1 [Eumeta japonica]
MWLCALPQLTSCSTLDVSTPQPDRQQFLIEGRSKKKHTRFKPNDLNEFKKGSCTPPKSLQTLERPAEKNFLIGIPTTFPRVQCKSKEDAW